MLFDRTKKKPKETITTATTAQSNALQNVRKKPFSISQQREREKGSTGKKYLGNALSFAMRSKVTACTISCVLVLRRTLLLLTVSATVLSSPYKINFNTSRSTSFPLFFAHSTGFNEFVSFLIS